MFYSSTLKNMSPEERKAFDAAQAKKRLIQPSEIAFWLGECCVTSPLCSMVPTSTPPWVWAPVPASRRRPV